MLRQRPFPLFRRAREIPPPLDCPVLPLEFESFPALPAHILPLSEGQNSQCNSDQNATQLI